MQPDRPKLETNPSLVAQQAQAQQALISNLQTEAQSDTANLMARYGTRLALAGSGASPIPAAAPLSPGKPMIRF